MKSNFQISGMTCNGCKSSVEEKLSSLNGVDDVQLFESSIPGKISLSIEEGGWGYDPIFIPDGESKTYANVSDKDKFSHRSASLKKFSNWFMHMQ